MKKTLLRIFKFISEETDILFVIALGTGALAILLYVEFL